MESAKLDRKRAWLIPYLQGWGWKLDECCSGMYIHRKAQVRQAIMSWLEVLQDQKVTLEQVQKIESLVPEVISVARAIYREHLAIKEREKKYDGRDF